MSRCNISEMFNEMTKCASLQYNKDPFSRECVSWPSFQTWNCAGINEVGMLDLKIWQFLDGALFGIENG